MAPPQITSWSDLWFVWEQTGPTGDFEYTMVVAVDGADSMYYAELPAPKAQLSFEQITSALEPVLHEAIYPKWPEESLEDQDKRISLVQAEQAADARDRYFIKRPNMTQYDVFSRNNVLHLLPEGLLEEARTMEFLSKHPHPHIIKYHGCQRSSRGYLTGIVLDRHPCDLEKYVKIKTEAAIVDKQGFMDALESAVLHLHSLGWAHNDLNPSNVLVDESSPAGPRPVLADFGSAREVGALMGTSRGTKGWYDGRIEDYTISKKENDLFALGKMRGWLEQPIFED